MPARMYNEKLARAILAAAAQCHPEPIRNVKELRELVPLMAATTFDEWMLTLQTLVNESYVSFERTFQDLPTYPFTDFLNLRVSAATLQQLLEPSWLSRDE